MGIDKSIDWGQAAKYLLMLIFVPSGRINQKQFAMCALLFIFGFYWFFTRDRDAGLLTQALNLYFTYTIFGKRLHDIGKSSKIILVYMIVTVILMVIGTKMIVDSFMYGGGGGTFGTTLLTLVPFAWVGWGVYLWRQATQPEVNRFGPPPLSHLLAGMPGQDDRPDGKDGGDSPPPADAPVLQTTDKP